MWQFSVSIGAFEHTTSKNKHNVAMSVKTSILESELENIVQR